MEREASICQTGKIQINTKYEKTENTLKMPSKTVKYTNQ